MAMNLLWWPETSYMTFVRVVTGARRDSDGDWLIIGTFGSQTDFKALLFEGENQYCLSRYGPEPEALNSAPFHRCTRTPRCASRNAGFDAREGSAT